MHLICERGERGGVEGGCTAEGAERPLWEGKGRGGRVMKGRTGAYASEGDGLTGRRRNRSEKYAKTDNSTEPVKPTVPLKADAQSRPQS